MKLAILVLLVFHKAELINKIQLSNNFILEKQKAFELVKRKRIFESEETYLVFFSQVWGRKS